MLKWLSQPTNFPLSFGLGWRHDLGFPGSSAGKESTFNAGDPSSISGLGSSPGERIGYPLQYSWASLMARTEKNPPAMREIWVWSPGWEDSVEEGMATHSSILAWRIPWTEEPGRQQFMESQKVRHDWAAKHRRHDSSVQSYGFKRILISTEGKAAGMVSWEKLLNFSRHKNPLESV